MKHWKWISSLALVLATAGGASLYLKKTERQKTQTQMAAFEARTKALQHYRQSVAAKIQFIKKWDQTKETKSLLSQVEHSLNFKMDHQDDFDRSDVLISQLGQKHIHDVLAFYRGDKTLFANKDTIKELERIDRVVDYYRAQVVQSTHKINQSLQEQKKVALPNFKVYQQTVRMNEKKPKT